MSTIALADAKTHLNITGTTYDTELQAMLDAAEAAIEQKCGLLTTASRTERIKGGGLGLVLANTPVVSLTSVTPVDGTAYTLDDLDLDTNAGVVERADGCRFPVGRYDVVYVTGRSSLPADLKLGVLELLRHLWASQRGPGRRPGSTAGSETANTIPGAAHLMPFRVVELISPHIQVGN